LKVSDHDRIDAYKRCRTDFLYGSAVARCGNRRRTEGRMNELSADAPVVPMPDGLSHDAFHRGGFYLVQPLRGHRAGSVAMMLAAAVPSGFSGRLADLGAGAGAAGLAVASRCPGAHVVLIEREAGMVY